MTLPELIDSLIELSTEEMPDKARQSLDNAIDHMVSSMTDLELNELFQKGFDKIEVIPPTDGDNKPHLKDETLEQEEILKQLINGNIAIA